MAPYYLAPVGPAIPGSKPETGVKFSGLGPDATCPDGILRLDSMNKGPGLSDPRKLHAPHEAHACRHAQSESSSSAGLTEMLMNVLSRESTKKKKLQNYT